MTENGACWRCRWFEHDKDAENGCKLMGLCELEKADRWGGTEKKMGVRFAL